MTTDIFIKDITATIFNIQHFSTHDGPGIRTVIFFKGCPLDCEWCHNPESKGFEPELSYDSALCIGCKSCEICPRGVHNFNGGIHYLNRADCIGCGLCADVCPTGSLELIGKRRTITEILDDASRDAVFFGDNGGITLSGGEPLAQPAAIALLAECKRWGFHTCVETSGYVSAEIIRASAESTDLFLYDCKETNSELHKLHTGVNSELVLSNLTLLDRLGAKVVLCCPIIPGINDNTAHFEYITHLASKHSSVISIQLEPYNPLGIAKSERIGRPLHYCKAEFLDKKELDHALVLMRKICTIPVRLS